MSILLLVNIFLAGFSHMTVTIRVAYAMARDGALPYSKTLKQLNFETKNPDKVLFVIFFADSLLCLLPLLSELAFTAITSITTIGYQLSYAIPILLRLTVSKTTFKSS